MLELKVNMKYLVNFQVEINSENNIKEKIRSTFTILGSDIKKIPENNFDMLKDWFINYFNENDLDKFIDVSKINNEYTINMKIGRITNSINGKYKTF